MSATRRTLSGGRGGAQRDPRRDGARRRLFDHVADCDACRDMSTRRPSRPSASARPGADFRAPDGFEERLVDALGERGTPSDAAARIRARGRASDAGQSASAGHRRRAGGAESTGDRATTAGSAAAAEGRGGWPRSPSACRSDPRRPTGAREDDGDAGARAIRRRGGARAPERAAGASGVSATTTTARHPSPRRPSIRRAPPRPSTDPPSSERDAAHDASRRLAHRRSAPTPGARKVSSAPPGVPGGRRRRGRGGRGGRLLPQGPRQTTDAPDPKAPWSGSVASSRAPPPTRPAASRPATPRARALRSSAGAEIKAGWTLRTDARTRAHVTLADGTDLALDRGTEVELGAKEDAGGAAQARDASSPTWPTSRARRAHFAFPRGDVEVRRHQAGDHRERRSRLGRGRARRGAGRAPTTARR